MGWRRPGPRHSGMICVSLFTVFDFFFPALVLGLGWDLNHETLLFFRVEFCLVSPRPDFDLAMSSTVLSPYEKHPQDAVASDSDEESITAHSGVKRIEAISSQFRLVERTFLFFGIFLMAYVYGLDGTVRYTYQVRSRCAATETRTDRTLASGNCRIRLS